MTLTPILGVAAFFVSIIAGQLAISMLCDAIGVFAPVRPAATSALGIAGVCLSAVGAYLLQIEINLGNLCGAKPKADSTAPAAAVQQQAQSAQAVKQQQETKSPLPSAAGRAGRFGFTDKNDVVTLSPELPSKSLASPGRVAVALSHSAADRGDVSNRRSSVSNNGTRGQVIVFSSPSPGKQQQQQSQQPQQTNGAAKAKANGNGARPVFLPHGSSEDIEATDVVEVVQPLRNYSHTPGSAQRTDHMNAPAFSRPGSNSKDVTLSARANANASNSPGRQQSLSPSQKPMTPSPRNKSVVAASNNNNNSNGSPREQQQQQQQRLSPGKAGAADNNRSSVSARGSPSPARNYQQSSPKQRASVTQTFIPSSDSGGGIARSWTINTTPAVANDATNRTATPDSKRSAAGNQHANATDSKRSPNHHGAAAAAAEAPGSGIGSGHGPRVRTSVGAFNDLANMTTSPHSKRASDADADLDAADELVLEEDL